MSDRSCIDCMRAVSESMSTAETLDLRNICIAAHIDHGKTTLCDCIVSYNGYVSRRQLDTTAEASAAGGHASGAQPARYMDSREDEIERQITVESSCMSLAVGTSTDAGSNGFSGPNGINGPNGCAGRILNLLDSPGHFDFLQEVDMAMSLSDGCLILVDCVEGLRAQTRQVMKQVWLSRVTPVLFINKVDRLQSTCRSPGDAYLRLRCLVEEVNAYFAGFLARYKDDNSLADVPVSLAEKYCFDPVLRPGSVLFGSGLHNWAFSVDDWLSSMVSTKIPSVGRSMETYRAALWANTPCKVVASAGGPRVALLDDSEQTDGDSGMFARFVIDQIWKAYDTGNISRLNSTLRAVNSVLKSVFAIVPNAALRYQKEIPELYESTTGQAMILVGKILPANGTLKTFIGDKLRDGMEISALISICRVVCGVVRTGDMLTVTDSSTNSGPQSSGESQSSGEHQGYLIRSVNALFGHQFLPIGQASAGAIVGIELEPVGLASIRSATQLSTSDEAEVPSLVLPVRDVRIGDLLSARPISSTLVEKMRTVFASTYQLRQEVQSILKVSIAATRRADNERIKAALELVCRCDPAVSMHMNTLTGEMVISCIGDEHLKRVVQDIRQIYAPGIDLEVSSPIVEFFESIADLSKETINDDTNDEIEESQIPPSPQWVTESLKTHDDQSEGAHQSEGSASQQAKSGVSSGGLRPQSGSAVSGDGSVSITVAATGLSESMLSFLEGLVEDHHEIYGLRKTSSLTPAHAQLVFDKFRLRTVAIHRRSPGMYNLLTHCLPSFDLGVGTETVVRSLASAFETVCSSGVTMGDPMIWTMFEISSLSVANATSLDDSASIHRTMVSACRRSLVSNHLRIVEPILAVNLFCDKASAVEGVVNRRRGQVTSADYVDESYNEQEVQSLVPAYEAFEAAEHGSSSFAEELRAAARGRISWEMAFAHFARIEAQHPLNPASFAHTLCLSVRRRKGLPIGEKVVRHGEKQRTLRR